MANGAIRFRLQEGIDPRAVAEEITVFPELSYFKVLEDYHLADDNEQYVLAEADCSLTFNCDRCGKVVCVRCSEDDPVIVGTDSAIFEHCWPCHLAVIAAAKKR